MKAQMLENRVAIVTGGAQGLGEAIVRKFAEEGAKVVIADMNMEKAEAIVNELKENSQEAMAIKVNVADKKSTDEMVESCISKYGRVDILINNAGILRDGMLHKMEEDQWDSVIKVNLYGTYNCARSCIDHMIEQKYGRIVNLSSLARLGNVGQTNYSATKAGVVGLARTWGKELGKYNITANAIAPGAIDTEMWRKVPEKYQAPAIAAIPLRRVGKPEDIANAALFLCSDLGEYVTGQIIHVDGGSLTF